MPDPVAVGRMLRWRATLIALLICAAAMASCARVVDSQTIPVLNGGFDDGTLYWTTDEPQSIDFSITADGDEAGGAARLLPLTNLPRMTLLHRVRSVPRVEENREYRFSARVRSESNATVVMAVVEASKEGEREIETRVELATDDWQSVTVSVRPQVSDASLSVSISTLDARARSTLWVDDVQVEGPTAATRQGCGTTERGLPLCGGYVGGSVGLNEDPADFEQQVGGRLAIRRTFFQADQVDEAVLTARADLARGRLPWVSFKFPASWEAMAQGQGDEWARDIASRLGDLDGPVWVAFHHEPEKDGDIALWRRTQERLAPIVRSTAPTVAYTVILMGYHQVDQGELVDGDSPYSLDNLWPATTVDVLGIDPYNYYGVPGRSPAGPADLTSEYFQPIGAWAERRSIPWAVAETGYTEATSIIRPTWLKETYRGIRANGGIAMAYFNSEPANAVGDWGLYTPDQIDAYAELLTLTTRLTPPAQQ